jgi:uncharacterized membrane protein AbrB (regulator of aidB expression)
VTEVSIEAVPVAAGVLIGLLTWRLLPVRFRAAFLLGASALAGALITWASGELELSWAFVVFDMGQVVLAALVTSVVLTGRGRRTRAHV